MKKFYAVTLLTSFVFILSCQKDMEPVMRDSGQADIAAALKACGTPYDTSLVNFGGLQSGSIEVMNDSASYHVVIRELYTDYKISRVEILHGTEQFVINNIVGLIDCNTMFPRNPTVVVDYSPNVDSTVVIPIPFGTENCIYMHAHIKLTKRDGSGNEVHSFWIWNNGTTNASQNPCQQYFRYCRQNCNDNPPPGGIACGQLRTQTQGGWGAPPNGNNPGAYLHANFATAFPNGIKIGCMNGFTINMTNAAAITTLLPAGGTPAALKSSATNPTKIKNVLVGQVLALSLSVGFDNYFPDFGAGTQRLENMYIKSGKFKGMTVAQFLVIANEVLGGCSTAYKPSHINETASKINENYTDGNKNNGFLVCNPNQVGGDDDDDDDDDDGDDDDDDDDDDNDDGDDDDGDGDDDDDD